MTRKICAALLFPMAMLGGFSVDAQKVTVLKQDTDQPQTVVEVDKDYVIVNGDTVARPGDRSYRKIVIDREEDAPGMNMRSFGFGKPGSAQKARLGVLTDPQQSKGGAYIREVQPGSPAQAAGLKAGDVITSVDGSSIADAKELVETISAHAPDDTVKIAYERDGKKRTTTAYLEGVASEDRSAQGRMFSIPNDPFGGGGFGKMFEGMMGGRGNVETPKIGVTVEERMDGNGVEATAVASGSVAEKAGLRKGDIITQLGDTKIDSPETLQQAIREHQGKEVTLRYQRAGKSMSTKITPPQKLQKMDM